MSYIKRWLEDQAEILAKKENISWDEAMDRLMEEHVGTDNKETENKEEP